MPVTVNDNLHFPLHFARRREILASLAVRLSAPTPTRRFVRGRNAFVNLRYTLTGFPIAFPVRLVKSTILLKPDMKRALLRLLLVTLLLLAVLYPRAHAAGPPIHVILWFDTEDYILPAADDAAKRLCEILAERGIRGTFKVVGEKARVLEKRGRRDVIEALCKHDVAFHSDFHSLHPTPTEYLADCGWDDGVAEFVRREGQGAADVKRVFSKHTLACYGQPGSSWAPQAVAALPLIGVAPHSVPCYVDEGTHVGWDGQPFWYAGALNVYHMSPNYTRMELHDPAAVAPAQKEVSEIATRLHGKGGGVISIFYHPCEWVHREFWDGVNFRRGANPPREEWKLPPQRTAEETQGAFKRFAEYIDYIRTIPGVQWITASDLPLLYPDLLRTEGAPQADAAELAKRIVQRDGAGRDVIRLGNRAYSVADQFEVLTLAIAGAMLGNPPNGSIKTKGLVGPDGAPPASTLASMPWPAFGAAVRDVLAYTKTNQRVPARVFIGADPVAPADFLVAMARAWEYRSEHGEFPVRDGVAMGKQNRVLPERRVAEDTPDLFGGWVIHKENFRAPRLMELARLQAWSLKPAIRKSD